MSTTHRHRSWPGMVCVIPFSLLFFLFVLFCYLSFPEDSPIVPTLSLLASRSGMSCWNDGTIFFPLEVISGLPTRSLSRILQPVGQVGPGQARPYSKCSLCILPCLLAFPQHLCPCLHQETPPVARRSLLTWMLKPRMIKLNDLAFHRRPGFFPCPEQLSLLTPSLQFQNPSLDPVSC